MVDSDAAAIYPSIPHQVGPLPEVFPLILQDGIQRSTTPNALAGAAKPNISVLTETLVAADLSDEDSIGLATSAGTIPAGAIVLGTKVVVTTGFTENVSAALKIGTEADDDRYVTDSIDVFTAAPNGLGGGVPSGVKYHDEAQPVLLTMTVDSDITPVIAGAGSLTWSIYYIATI